MSSGDTRRDLENVRQLITDDIEASLQNIEYKLMEAMPFLEAAIVGYVNLNGIDSVRRALEESNRLLLDFRMKQAFASAMLMTAMNSL